MEVIPGEGSNRPDPYGDQPFKGHCLLQFSAAHHLLWSPQAAGCVGALQHVCDEMGPNLTRRPEGEDQAGLQLQCSFSW